jgi:pyruvate formate lyase activating enzyme
MFDRRKCISCLECVKASRNGEFVLSEEIPTPGPSDVVTIQREKIRNALVFKEICPAKAITVVGEEKSVQEILAEIKKDLLFYENSGGGVTVSGGEPFAQPDVLHELLQELKNLEIHIAVETCLHVSWEHLQNNVNDIDVFLADLKHTDPEKFRKYTGGNLDLILSNLKHLEEIGATVIIRIPVIPGFNHTEAEMQRILDAAASLANVHEVHFIPYHALGSNKYTLLGRNYDPPLSSLAEDEVKQYIEYARTKGLRANVGG